MTSLIQATWIPTTCPVCNFTGAREILGVRSERLLAQTLALQMQIEDALCLRCGFVHAAARPDEASLLAYYRDAHIRSSEFIYIKPDYDLAGRIDRIARFVRPRGRILELGAGTGEFCAELEKAGWQARPVDPLGGSTLPQAAAGFDALLAYLVLEHVYDPRSFVENAVRHLAPGGIFIVEVPDFVRDPVSSLVSEHLWHYTPEHLSALLADFGLNVIDIDRSGASRPFAFAVAARRENAPRRTGFPEDVFDSARSAYARAKIQIEAEEKRARLLAEQVASAAPSHIYVWGANIYATRIGRRLAEIAHTHVHIVDSAASKIGTLHDGFSRPIEAPVFSRDEAKASLFLLCSPSWNTQIRAQIEGMGLVAPRIVDAISWQPGSGL